MTAIVEIDTFVVPQPRAANLSADLETSAAALRSAFGVAFTFWHSATGELLHASVEQPASNDPFRGELARALHRAVPQFIADEDLVVLLAVPLALRDTQHVVATAAFAVRTSSPHEFLNGTATLLGLDPAEAMAWIARQDIWSQDALLRLAGTAQAQVRAEMRAAELSREVDKLSDHLASTYEEICLLHSVTQNLRISSDEQQLSSLILRWLLDCLPTKAVAIQLLPVARDDEVTYKARTSSVLYSVGECPLDNEDFTRLIDSLELQTGCGPYVANHAITQAADWPFPKVEQLILVPLAEGHHVLGWLALINHNTGAEFGTVEASLVNSVGAILGIHASNRDLYRQQSEFLASVVRALTSAIDAKDQYTCGHSDRVARIAVRLAKEMGCDPELLHTLYMAGLLHDIGKIGISDTVLRKPDKLTEAEFEHIKEHPELGYRILADIKPLADVLPAVLHHHEQWDGRGYPCRLVGDQIPLIARIVAVADAYDAMSSDRPYRRGIPVPRVEEMFRFGAGKQWDGEVINAYFAARDDIQSIAGEERANLSLDVEQWT